MIAVDAAAALVSVFVPVVLVACGISAALSFFGRIAGDF